MKKVLLITYYWPPAGGPGVQRWLKFVTHLPQFGIQPVLFIPENPEYPQVDDTLLGDLPKGISVYRGKIREPLRWASWFGGGSAKKMSSGQLPGEGAGWKSRLLMWLRANLLVPDARVLWVRPSVPRLLEIMESEGIDTVITTGPPHSVHLIGLQAKKHRNLNWIADFRDPWTRISYHAELPMTDAVKRRHAHLEQQVLAAADQVIATSKTTAAELKKIRGKEVQVITNGFDEQQYQAVEVPLDSEFTLSHIGSLLKDRNPVNLWSVLGELRAEDEEFRQHFKLQIIGNCSDVVKESICKAGLEECTSFLGYVHHGKAIALQKSSQSLLLIEIDRPETRGIIPGKLFEYLASGRPVLAVGPEQWEAGQLLQESGNGRYFGYEDKEGIRSILLQWFKKYQQGGLPSGPAQVEKYTRKALTKELAKLL